MVSCKFGLLFISLILFNSSIEAEFMEFLDHSCSTTLNGTYGKNIKHLFSSLTSSSNKNSTSATTGFYNSSYGETPNKLYAIGFCRGDTKPRSCASCINEAAHDLLSGVCPEIMKEGVKMNENCTLRYSASSISGVSTADEGAYIYIYSYDTTQKTSKSSWFGADGFDQRRTTLLGSLISEAASGSGVRKFSVGHSNATNKAKTTIYGLAQCSPDLPKDNCTSCFGLGLGHLPLCCYTSWRYNNAFCNIRYEPYLFYDPAFDPTPMPAQSSNSPGKKSGTLGTSIILILVSIGVLLAI